jgi:hypothetical protein
MMNKEKVKIELYKSKEMAKFSHYVSGVIYYTVQLEEGKFQFPMLTTEERKFKLVEETADGDVTLHSFTSKGLSSDLGTTSFYNEIKGSELNRWISKAIDNEEFIRVG